MYLDLDLLMSSLLLLDRLLLFIVRFVLEIDLDTESIAKLLDASTLSTNDVSDIVTVDLELK